MFDTLMYILWHLDVILIPVAMIISVILLAATAEDFDPWQPMSSITSLAISFSPIAVLGFVNVLVSLLAVGEFNPLGFIGIFTLYLTLAVIIQTVAVVIFLAFWSDAPLASRLRRKRVAEVRPQSSEADR